MGARANLSDRGLWYAQHAPKRAELGRAMTMRGLRHSAQPVAARVRGRVGNHEAVWDETE